MLENLPLIMGVIRQLCTAKVCKSKTLISVLGGRNALLRRCSVTFGTVFDGVVIRTLNLKAKRC